MYRCLWWFDSLCQVCNELEAAETDSGNAAMSSAGEAFDQDVTVNVMRGDPSVLVQNPPVVSRFSFFLLFLSQPSSTVAGSQGSRNIRLARRPLTCARLVCIKKSLLKVTI